MTPEELRYLDAKFDSVNIIATAIKDDVKATKDSVKQLEQRYDAQDARLNSLDAQLLSHRVRLEAMESRVPLLTQSEGRIIAKVFGLLGTIGGALYGLYHWVVNVGIAVGMAVGMVKR